MEARGGLNYFHNEALSEGDGPTTAEEVGIRGANIDEWTSGMTSIDFGTGPVLGSECGERRGVQPTSRDTETFTRRLAGFE